LTEEKAHSHRVFVGKSESEIPLGRPGMDVRIIIKWVLKKWDGKA
jgi:hypothetical protein